MTNPSVHIDFRTAEPSRITDYLLGGQANFEADRTTIEHITSALPGGSETARVTAKATQAFVDRASRFLAHDAGVRQYLRVGTLLPSGTQVHDVVQQAIPDARVLYVISDDVVLAHAHRLKPLTPEGVTTFLRGSLHDPEVILTQAAETLDFAEPIGLVLGGLAAVEDGDLVYSSVSRLVKELAPGSYVTLTHVASDLGGKPAVQAIGRLAAAVEARQMNPLAPRSRDEIARFFDGLELVDPGLVPVDQWRPDPDDPAPDGDARILCYAGVGRKG